MPASKGIRPATLKDRMFLLFIILQALSYILRTTKLKEGSTLAKNARKKPEHSTKRAVHHPLEQHQNLTVIFFNPYTSKSSVWQDEQFISIQYEDFQGNLSYFHCFYPQISKMYQKQCTKSPKIDFNIFGIFGLIRVPYNCVKN